MKRFLILALVCLMLLPVLAACGNKTTPPATTTEKKTEAGDESVTDVPEDLYKPSRDLTALDYKDEIVRILQCDFKKDEFDFNAGSSETMSNAVYARNKQVEEDLGILSIWLTRALRSGRQAGQPPINGVRATGATVFTSGC